MASQLYANFNDRSFRTVSNSEAISSPITLISQILLLIVVASLCYGVLGRFGLSHHTLIDLFLITLWQYCWIGSSSAAWRWAVMTGLLVDAISFHYFGLYLATYLIITYAILFLKDHYFQVLSFMEAELCLVGANVIVLAIGLLNNQIFHWQTWLYSIIVNAILGGLIYHVVAIRSRIFSHWRGARV